MRGGWQRFWAVSILAIWAAVVPVGAMRADIFAWEYIDPLNPALGKQPSSTLVPDGAGKMPVPNANLGNRNLTKAYLIGADLTDGELFASNLTNADLSQSILTNVLAAQANFTNADLVGANLTRTNFQKAILTGARMTDAAIDFGYFRQTVATGFTASQLYSTANYKAGNLKGVNLNQNDLTGWSFSGISLADSQFESSILTNADFTAANIRNADLRAGSGVSGLMTLAQVYSTASYQIRDLSGVQLSSNNFSTSDFAGVKFVGAQLTGINFSNSNLSQSDFTNATLSGNLLNTNLQQAKLTGARVWATAWTNANITGAEVRDASFSATTSQGFTAAHLYSTASYEAGDLRGIRLDMNDLAGWDFSGQNLTGASLGAKLQNAKFTNANLSNADFAEFSSNAELAGADFSGAAIQGATFSAYLSGSGITQEQFKSSASYQTGDLAGVTLFYHNLSGWNLAAKELSGAIFRLSDLSGADLSNSNLSNADLGGAELTNADLIGANLSGAILARAPQNGLTPAQFYSTASYQARDLRGINWHAGDLSGWNFANQDMTGVDFLSTKLAGTDFTGAIIRSARLESIQPNSFSAAQLYTTASYQARDLRGVTLHYFGFASLDLSNQDLSDADLSLPWNVVDLAGAKIKGTQFRMSGGGSPVTFSQIAATASYQSGQLQEFKLEGVNVTVLNWDLSEKDLRRAHFAGHFEAGGLTLDNFNFRNANLADVTFEYTAFRNVNFRGADTRGAAGGPVPANDSLLQNMISSEGRVKGLDLRGGDKLLVRDYDGIVPTEIFIEDGFAADESSSLELVFAVNDWGSLISFESGIPVTIGGKLQLDFADGVDVAGQIGRVFRVFDWSGVAPDGTFEIDSSYLWDVSRLYTAGEIQLVAVPEPSSLLVVVCGWLPLSLGARIRGFSSWGMRCRLVACA